MYAHFCGNMVNNEFEHTILLLVKVESAYVSVVIRMFEITYFFVNKFYLPKLTTK